MKNELQKIDDERINEMIRIYGDLIDFSVRYKQGRKDLGQDIQTLSNSLAYLNDGTDFYKRFPDAFRKIDGYIDEIRRYIDENEKHKK